MNSDIENFYNKLEKPQQEVFLFLKQYILNFDENINIQYKWKLPYLYYKSKPLCYFWRDAKTQEPYLGFARGKLIKHPSLISGDRTTIKIFPVPANQDIDLTALNEILHEALKLY